MDLLFDYKGICRLLLAVGTLLGLAAIYFGWLPVVGAAVCFVYAIIAHISHVGQLLAKESLEIRKRLTAMDQEVASAESK